MGGTKPLEGPTKEPGLRLWLRVRVWPGYHTIQNLYGCDLLSGSYSSHGQYKLSFNGHDYVVLNEDLRAWTSVGKAAEMLRRKWEESDFAQVVQTYLEKECMKLLLTQLDYGRKTLLRTGKNRYGPICSETGGPVP